MRTKKGISALLPGIIVICLYCSIRMIKQSPALPKLTDIVRSAVAVFSSGKFYDNLAYTLKIVVIGIGISFVFGVIIAVICSLSKIINSLIMPVINSIKNIPSISLFPLFIVLMGIGDVSRIAIIIWNSLYPIIASSDVGIRSPEKEVVEAARLDGADDFNVCLHIRIPIATLDILNGLKISFGNGFIAIVVAEMLGATKGIGYMILWSANSFQYPQMYVYILSVAFVGLLINVMIEKIIIITERKLYS